MTQRQVALTVDEEAYRDIQYAADAIPTTVAALVRVAIADKLRQMGLPSFDPRPSGLVTRIDTFAAGAESPSDRYFVSPFDLDGNDVPREWGIFDRQSPHIVPSGAVDDFVDSWPNETFARRICWGLNHAPGPQMPGR